MRVWWALCCAAAAVGAATGAAPGCDVTVDGDAYRRQTLVNDMQSAYGMAVDYTANVLYFSYRPKSLWFSASLDLVTGALKKMEELTGQCMFTVDQVRQYVHAGCEGEVGGRGRGLYQFDSHPGRFVLAGEEGQRVTFVHYNDALYYSAYSSFLLYKFQRGRGVRVPDLASQVLGLVVDKHNEWIFQNVTAVYRQRAGAEAKPAPTGIYFRSVLAVDRRGDAYVCGGTDATFGIHRVTEQAPGPTLVLPVKFCTGFTFDRDNNIIYGDYDRIVRLLKC